jgi:hypothetical protein
MTNRQWLFYEVFAVVVLLVCAMLWLATPAHAGFAHIPEHGQTTPKATKVPKHHSSKWYVTLHGGRIAAKARAKHHYSHSQAKAALRAEAKHLHLSKRDVKDLLVLVKRESDFNPRCVTGSYRGLLQIRTRSSLWADPMTNVGIAISKMKRYYHARSVHTAIHRARRHSDRYGWW